MPIQYQDVVQGAPRDALSVPSSREDVLRETFAQAFEENPIKAYQRWRELKDAEQEGPMLAADTARAQLKEAGMERDLTVSDAGITQAALDTLMWRKKIERRRQETFARSEGGFVEGAQRLGVAIGTTLADPISAGLNFVPVVGQARYARWLSRAGSLAARMGVRAGVGAAEGVVGAALAEIPIYQMRTQEQADYDSTDSLLNVAFGGLVGAGLHATVGTAGELISRALPNREPAPRVEPTIGEPATRSAEGLPGDIQRAIFEPSRMADVVESLPSEVRQTALRAAVGQAVEGRPIDVEPIVQAAQDEISRSVTIESKPQVDGAEFISARSDAGLVGGTLRDGQLKVVTADIPQENLRGQGRGVAMYESLARTAHERGAVLASDNTVEEASVRVYDALARRGYDVHRNPAARPLEGEFPGLFAPKDQPVFTVGPKQEAMPRISSAPAVDTEYRAATQQAETAFARDIEPTTEANLKAAEEEADLATADAKGLVDRLGLKFDDPDIAAVEEAIVKAERWARAAELATVCLTRGG